MTRKTLAARHAFARVRHHRASRASSPVPPPPLASARALQRRRSLGRSIARTRCSVGGGGGGQLHRTPRASDTSRASLVTRAHAHITTASGASSPFSVPPAHDRHAPLLRRRRRSLVRSIARSRAHGVALAMEVAVGYTARHARQARVHIRHHRASRASSPPPSPMSTMRARGIRSLTHLQLRTSPRRTPHMRARSRGAC